MDVISVYRNYARQIARVQGPLSGFFRNALVAAEARFHRRGGVYTEETMALAALGLQHHQRVRDKQVLKKITRYLTGARYTARGFKKAAVSAALAREIWNLDWIVLFPNTELSDLFEELRADGAQHSQFFWDIVSNSVYLSRIARVWGALFQENLRVRLSPRESLSVLYSTREFSNLDTVFSNFQQTRSHASGYMSHCVIVYMLVHSPIDLKEEDYAEIAEQIRPELLGTPIPRTMEIASSPLVVALARRGVLDARLIPLYYETYGEVFSEYATGQAAMAIAKISNGARVTDEAQKRALLWALAWDKYRPNRQIALPVIQGMEYDPAELLPFVDPPVPEVEDVPDGAGGYVALLQRLVGREDAARVLDAYPAYDLLYTVVGAA